MQEPSGPATRATERVRRLELAAALSVVVLLVLTGLAYTTGLLVADGPEPGDDQRPAYRPLVADIDGTVEYRPQGAADWRPLTWSDGFSAGDRLRTAPNSTCDVLLTWGTGFRLVPGTELTWKRLRTDGRSADVELFLSRGRVLADLDALPKGSKFVVETPHSRTRVKGTVLSVRVDAEGTTTTVLEGVVEVVDRSNPHRRVEVRSEQRVDVDGLEEAPLVALSAEERARILGELGSLQRSLDRLSPGGDREVAKGRVSISAEGAPAQAEGVREDSAAAPDAPGDVVAAEQEVAGLLRTGLALLGQGRAEEALGLCSPTFRTVIWGDMAQRAGALREFRREEGVSLLLQSRNEVQGRVALHFELQKLAVTVDGDVAYGTATVVATATRTGEAGSVARTYACTARCLREGGRWLVDVATATEQGDR